MRFLPAVAALALLAPPALAQEVSLGMRVSQEYDDNAFSDGDREFHDYNLRIAPRALLEEQRGDVRWSLRYEPSFATFYRSGSDLNGWDHTAQARANIRLGPRTQISLSDVFGSYQSRSRANEVLIGEDGFVTSEVVFRRDRVNRNTFNVALNQSITRDHSVNFAFTHRWLPASNSRGSDVQSFNLTSSYRLVATERSSYGLGLSVTRQHAGDSDLRESRNTDFFNLFGSWEHSFDPTLRLSVSGGPALVDGEDPSDPPFSVPALRFPTVRRGNDFFFVDFASCPTEDGFVQLTAECEPIGPEIQFPGFLPTTPDNQTTLALVGSPESLDNQSVTYFANVSLTKSWEEWNGSLSYSRSATATSGLGTSEISDVVRSLLQWRPSPRWRVNLSGVFQRRTQANDQRVTVIELGEVTMTPLSIPVPVGGSEVVARRQINLENDLELFQYLAEVSAHYQWKKRVSLFGRIFFSRQDPRGDVQFSREVDDFRVSVGVNYDLEPFHL